MRKLCCFVLTVALIFSLAACAEKPNTGNEPYVSDSEKPDFVLPNPNYSGESRESESPPKAKDATDDGVVVTTLEEFTNALKPGATLIIPESGITFFPDETWGSSNEYMEWDYIDYDLNPLIRNLSGLTLRGTPNALGKLLSTSETAFVLCFENCDNITIENISAGHEVPGHCSGGVFYFDGCKDITILGSELFGCGTEGLYLEDVNGFTMSDSVIYECTYSLSTIVDSRNVTFQNTVFRDTGSFGHMFNISESQRVQFDDCKFTDNFVQNNVEFAAEQHYSFFSMDEDSRDIEVKNSEFRGNHVPCLTDSYMLMFDNCQFFDNLFEELGPGLMGTYFPSPDFLTAEQQNLYYFAKELYLDNMGPDWVWFSVVRGEIDYSSTVEINGLPYYTAQGEFDNWDDLYAYYTDIFTPAYADALLGVHSLFPAFVEENGVLYTIFGNRGSHIDWVGNPDRYIPGTATNERVEFEVVCQYEDNETGSTYVEGVPIVMVNTPHGWRVELFNLTY